MGGGARARQQIRRCGAAEEKARSLSIIHFYEKKIRLTGGIIKTREREYWLVAGFSPLLPPIAAPFGIISARSGVFSFPYRAPHRPSSKLLPLFLWRGKSRKEKEEEERTDFKIAIETPLPVLTRFSNKFTERGKRMKTQK